MLSAPTSRPNMAVMIARMSRAPTQEPLSCSGVPLVRFNPEEAFGEPDFAW